MAESLKRGKDRWRPRGGEDETRDRETGQIFDITLRDGSQSKVATRIKLEDLLTIAEKLADSGIYGAETWGGATFDVCVRYLKEDPWERARILKQTMPNVQSMMLIRGQNLVAYSNFADDVVYKFVHAAARNGIDDFAFSMPWTTYGTMRPLSRR